MSPARVALLTGASGGIGRAIAQVFEGDTVVRQSRSPERGDVHGDLTSDDDVARMVGEVVSRHGHIDVLIINAADQMIGDASPRDATRWLSMLDATLLSAVRLTAAAVPHMPAGSAVVNVSSLAASLAFPDNAPYAAAKAALEAFTRSLALDLGPLGIRANAVAPGLVERDGLAQDWPEGYAAWSAGTPRGRIVTPEEVAGAVRFLAGPDAAGISGVVLPVDAGWSASGRLL